MTTLAAMGMFAAVMIVAWWTAWLLLKFRTFSKLLDEDTQDRTITLDGIRGFLALSVFFHHCFVHQYFLEFGAWIQPRNQFITSCGSVPVLIFFAITGFLFWSRAIRGGAKINVRSFAVSRFFRIAPLFLVATLVAFFLAWQSTSFQWQGDSGETYVAVTRLLMFGAFRIDFFNGVDLVPITAGVTWTLVYEWVFYAFLPILAWFAKLSRFVILGSLILLLLAISPIGELNYASVFLVGMIAAHLIHEFPNAKLPKENWPSVAVTLVLLGAMFSSQQRPSLVAFVYLLPAFIAIAFGVDLFGVLRTRPARLLGASSYSIYLLHGIILYIFLQFGLGKARVAGLETPAMFGLMLLLTVVVCVASCIAYAVIERPMIAIGRRVAQGTKTR